jgi:hypothetical protein
MVRGREISFALDRGVARTSGRRFEWQGSGVRSRATYAFNLVLNDVLKTCTETVEKCGLIPLDALRRRWNSALYWTTEVVCMRASIARSEVASRLGSP